MFQSTGGDDSIYSTAVCRGDLDENSCQICVNDLSEVLPDLCPDTKSAIMSNDKCMLRYSNETGHDNPLPIPPLYLSDTNVNSSIDMGQFKLAVHELIYRLSDRAHSNSNTNRYAGGYAAGPNHITIFGFVNCDPAAFMYECGYCLKKAYNDSEGVCQENTGCFGVLAECNFRYETYSFFNVTKVSPPAPSPRPPPPPLAEPPPLTGPPPPPDKVNTNNTDKKPLDDDTTLIIVLIGFVIVVFSVSIFVVRLRRYRNQMASVKKEDIDEDIGAAELLKLDFSVVRASTTDFSQQNELGRGGFGTVYKGMLPDGREIAVKRLSPDSRQGEKEFKNEVLLMSQFLHRNLVKLIGFSIEGSERLLIYEFLANSSLDSFIFGPAKRGRLDWKLRCKIIIGIAKGLLYLHGDSGLSVVHRDLKLSNVLLDAEMNSKIADFGMARLFASNTEAQRQTDWICGTYGYMAPEYAMQGHFSLKSDVFSFGVLVLEVITGQSNRSVGNDDTTDDFLTHARTCSNLIDSEMNAETGQLDQILKVIHIGLLCCQVNANERPTMDSVVGHMGTISMSMLTEPCQPSYYLFRNVDPIEPVIHEAFTSTHQNPSQQILQIPKQKINHNSSFFSVSFAAMSTNKYDKVYTVTSVTHLIPIKLDLTKLNYTHWSTLFNNHCSSFNVDSFLSAASTTDPPTEVWKKADLLVLGWIYLTISERYLKGS
ncbi:cysteine-rich receptor-like protein kinase 26 [Rutidosis leptorrhynchoides]|uniref:cysteine-rich receptor-like protein kinase 26 n=1 Tax=Rutidosis leptorrhynchoides TaxID=125765 RepID=UPI003A99691D